jgi:hypothetical protein
LKLAATGMPPNQPLLPTVRATALRAAARPAADCQSLGSRGCLMTKVDPGWSFESLLRTFQPHESWRNWFAEAYAQAMESPAPEEQLKGWETAAVIFRDMNACVLMPVRLLSWA